MGPGRSELRLDPAGSGGAAAHASLAPHALALSAGSHAEQCGANLERQLGSEILTLLMKTVRWT